MYLKKIPNASFVIFLFNLFFIWQQFKTECRDQVTVWLAETVSNKCMKTQELFDDIVTDRFSISENTLLASDLFSGDHVTKYDCHFSARKYEML